VTQTTEAVSIWLSLGHHSVNVFLEPREGGRRARAAPALGAGTSEPATAALAWQLTPEWNYDPDPAKATEVEVTFIAEEDGTRVTLEHRGFDVHGEAGAGMRESVSSEGGWQQLLQLYRDAA